jgi:hypothetical protein
VYAFLAAYAQSIQGDPTYAWIITEDKIDDGNSLGVAGPGDAPEELFQYDDDNKIIGLVGKTWTFRLYDDDGIHYFTGKLTTTEQSPEDDETGPNGALSAPLDGYGEAFGCTRISWHGKPEWEIG